MGRDCMGRVGYGPSLSWAEFVMGRVVQLPSQLFRVVPAQNDIDRGQLRLGVLTLIQLGHIGPFSI